MTLGSGVDLMEVARFEEEEARRGGGLVEELFGPGELAWCRRRRRPCEGYAMVYAAKEALFKALGTGKVGRMAWSDIEIVWPPGAAGPAMALTGETAAVAAAKGVNGVHVTMTSTRQVGAAWVVVAGRGSCPGRSRLCSGDLRPSSLRPDGKRPGHPRPDAGATDEPRIPTRGGRRR